VAIPGAAGPSYTTPPAKAADHGALFRCTVQNAYGSATSRAARLDVRLTDTPFRRGDANGDGSMDIADAIRMLQILFAGAENPCEDARDTNDDGSTNIADAVSLLMHLFVQGAAPPAPYPACGGDPTPDGLDCRFYDACP
jgi:hypothetical protein